MSDVLLLTQSNGGERVVARMSAAAPRFVVPKGERIGTVRVVPYNGEPALRALLDRFEAGR